MAEESTRNPALRRWHISPEEAAKRAHRSRRVFLLLAGIMALGGAFIAWLILIGRFDSPMLLTIPITQYDPPWPVNPLADRDSELLIQNHFPDVVRQKAYTSQSQPALGRELQNLDKVRAGKSLVVHLCAEAIVREGIVYLLPANAKPENPASWLPLTDVLKWIGNSPAREKLLVLDIMRPNADPRLGIPANDVSDHVQRLLHAMDEADQLRFWVLCACAEGQLSLVSQHLGQSVFSFYLNEGLSGYADGYPPLGKRTGRVCVQELASFLRARVDRWTVANRGVHQTPVLFGKGPDFALAVLPHSKPKREPEAEPAGAFPPSVAQGWQLRDTWIQSGAFRAAPGALRQLEETLIRAEKRCRAGPDTYTDPASKIKSLAREVDEVQSRRQPRTRSVVEAARQKGMQADAAIVKGMGELLAELDVGTDAKMPAADASKKLQEALKKHEKLLTDLRNKQGLEKALLVWEAATREDGGPPVDRKARHLQRLGLLSQTEPQYEEMLFLLRLTRLNEKQPPSAVILAHALEVLADRQRVAKCEPRAFVRLQKQFQQTASSRLAAEQLLFGNDSLSDKADVSFVAAHDQYRALIEAINILEQAHGQLDVAMVRLPAFAGYLWKRLELDADDGLEKKWSSALRTAKQLDELMTRTERLDQLDAIRDESHQLQRVLQELGEEVAWEKRKPRVHVDPAGWRELELLLEIPWHSAESRKSIWEKKAELERELCERTRQRDTVDNKSSTPTAITNTLETASGAPEKERAVRRARLAITLLKWGDLAEASVLEKALDDAQRGPLDAGPWAASAGNLYKAWVQAGPSRVSHLSQSADWSGAHRLSMVFPSEPGAAWVSSSAETNPAHQLYRQAEIKFWKWLENDYRTRAKNADGVFQEFFMDAVREYASLAQK
jgi:hypothetical protein